MCPSPLSNVVWMGTRFPSTRLTVSHSQRTRKRLNSVNWPVYVVFPKSMMDAASNKARPCTAQPYTCRLSTEIESWSRGIENSVPVPGALRCPVPLARVCIHTVRLTCKPIYARRGQYECVSLRAVLACERPCSRTVSACYSHSGIKHKSCLTHSMPVRPRAQLYCGMVTPSVFFNRLSCYVRIVFSHVSLELLGHEDLVWAHTLSVVSSHQGPGSGQACQPGRQCGI